MNGLQDMHLLLFGIFGFLEKRFYQCVSTFIVVIINIQSINL